MRCFLMQALFICVRVYGWAVTVTYGIGAPLIAEQDKMTLIFIKGTVGLVLLLVKYEHDYVVPFCLENSLQWTA